MMNKKTMTASAVAIICAAVFGIVALHVPSAHAATAVNADCGITAADLAQITAIQNDPSLSPSDEIKQELAVRKQLVGVTIVCAEQETQLLHTNLQNASVESDMQSLQSQMLGNLNQSSDFYNTELTKLGVVGIAGTKAIAQEVFAWRANVFVPQSEGANNLMLWSKNQSLFTTAQTRMTQTQQAVSYLEGVTPNASLQTAFAAAQASFSDAQTENAAAKTALLTSVAPDQTYALIKKSLASLSDTYDSFSTVSAIIKKNLPQ